MFKGTHFWFVVNELYVYNEKKNKKQVYINLRFTLCKTE